MVDVCTRDSAGEGEDDNVVVGPGVIGVWRVEGQALGALLAQVQQDGGVDHGNRVTAFSVPVPGREVLGCPTIVTLKHNQNISNQTRTNNILNNTDSTVSEKYTADCGADSFHTGM